ncbi:MAG: hemolysin family protein [Candidatus Eisenbacteria bacterium]
MNQILLYVLLIVLGVGASAYFSAIEISIISANRLKLRQQAKQGNATATLALSLLNDQEHVLATTLIGLNLANLATAAFVTSLIEGWLGVGWRASLLSTGVATLVLLVMGEILPKVYASRHATVFVTRNARPIQATEQLFLPATAVIRLFLGLLLRSLRKAPQQPLVTREDLKHLVREVKGDTGHGRKEKKMLGSLLGFTETTAREVMVPMTEVIAIEKGSGISLARALAKRHGFTRLAVYERRIDKVTGVVNIKDVLFDKDPDETVAHYVRPALLVPETKRIDRLLVELQRSEQTMAIVVSEFGSCVGIVTLEDIVEEIVGEMAEEHEVGVRKIREIAPGTYVVDALTDIDDLNDELGLELPKGRFDTLAGLLLKHYGRIPTEGERCRISEVEMEIVDAHQFGIGSVKLVLPNGSVDRD